MKKIVLAALSIILLFAMTGCCLSHDWETGDCVTPMTCKKCGETEGEPIGHVLSDWEIVKEATFAETGLKQKVCFVCGQVIETEVIERSIGDGSMLYDSEGNSRSAFDFTDSYGELLSYVAAEAFDQSVSVVKDASSSIGSYFIENRSDTGTTMISFSKNGDAIPESGAFDQINMLGKASSATDATNFALYAGIMIYAVDPSIGEISECVGLAVNMMNEMKIDSNEVAQTINGKTYSFSGMIISEDTMMLTFMVQV